ncbi:hypothetical protein ACHAWF_015544 [Thalassiosira exigua]
MLLCLDQLVDTNTLSSALCGEDIVIVPVLLVEDINVIDSKAVRSNAKPGENNRNFDSTRAKEVIVFLSIFGTWDSYLKSDIETAQARNFQHPPSPPSPQTRPASNTPSVASWQPLHSSTPPDPITAQSSRRAKERTRRAAKLLISRAAKPPSRRDAVPPSREPAGKSSCQAAERPRRSAESLIRRVAVAVAAERPRRAAEPPSREPEGKSSRRLGCFDLLQINYHVLSGDNHNPTLVERICRYLNNGLRILVNEGNFVSLCNQSCSCSTPGTLAPSQAQTSQEASLPLPASSHSPTTSPPTRTSS